ncbi:MAG TPA: hypothetical protein VGR50_01365, partial [Terriglobales bacterium]|nr:hypothetical protein [Terriglobales bacterium]
MHFLDRIAALGPEPSSDLVLQLAEESLELEQNPSEAAGLLLAAASCLSERGAFDSAESLINRARKLSTGQEPLEAYLLVCEAGLDIAKGNQSAALQKLDRAVSTYASFLTQSENRDLLNDITCKRAMLLTNEQRFEEAQPVLESCLSSAEPCAQKGELFFDLGLCYLDSKRYDSALDQLRHALSVDLPEHVHDRIGYYLGVCCYHLSRFQEAKEYFLDCERLGARFPLSQATLYSWLATTYRRLGDQKEESRYRSLLKIQ